MYAGPCVSILMVIYRHSIGHIRSPIPSHSNFSCTEPLYSHPNGHICRPISINLVVIYTGPLLAIPVVIYPGLYIAIIMVCCHGQCEKSLKIVITMVVSKPIYSHYNGPGSWALYNGRGSRPLYSQYSGLGSRPLLAIIMV
jgi:hypothetical protein